MKSFDQLRESAEQALLGAWSTLGLPLAAPPIQEAEKGLIDPESLILLTLLLGRQNRLTTDVPAWIFHFSNLVNHGKIKALLARLPNDQKKAVSQVMQNSPYEACPNIFKRSVGLTGPANPALIRELTARATKIRPVEALSRSCTMVNNRLLFGTGFRADLVSIVQNIPFSLRVGQVANLIGSAESTASRIIFDLQACGFLDRHNQPAEEKRSNLGLFISARSLQNASAMLEAEKFNSAELRQAALDDLDFRFDGLLGGS